MEKIVVLGNGGHARSVCDLLIQMGTYEIVGLIAKDDSSGFMGLSVIGDDDSLNDWFKKGIKKAFVAIGSNKVREVLTSKLMEIGYELVNAISPQAVISQYASIGTGVVIMPGAIINACAVIKDGSIINTRASVDHDVIIGEFCHVAPGVSICGTTKVGKGSFIGVGAAIIDGIEIGENVMIGAGAAVVSNLPNACLAVGVPAKVIKSYN